MAIVDPNMNYPSMGEMVESPEEIWTWLPVGSRDSSINYRMDENGIWICTSGFLPPYPVQDLTFDFKVSIEAPIEEEFVLSWEEL